MGVEVELNSVGPAPTLTYALSGSGATMLLGQPADYRYIYDFQLRQRDTGAPFTLYHKDNGVDPFTDPIYAGSPVPEASSVVSLSLLLALGAGGA